MCVSHIMQGGIYEELEVNIFCSKLKKHSICIECLTILFAKPILFTFELQINRPLLLKPSMFYTCILPTH